MVNVTIHSLATSRLLWSVGVAWFLAQALKVVTYYVRHRRLRLQRLAQPGGMPSSHAAMVIALLVGVGIREGAFSTLFIVTLVFALATIYEAIGVRRAAGEQAETINRLVEYISRQMPDSDLLRADYRHEETLGHTPLQVAIGSLIGLIISLALVP